MGRSGAVCYSKSSMNLARLASRRTSEERQLSDASLQLGLAAAAERDDVVEGDGAREGHDADARGVAVDRHRADHLGDEVDDQAPVVGRPRVGVERAQLAHAQRAVEQEHGVDRLRTVAPAAV